MTEGKGFGAVFVEVEGAGYGAGDCIILACA
jgi:hypothetical protein